jgi:hypothetical protein
MQSDEQKPKPDHQPDPLGDRKSTAPPETRRGLSPREAARMWGIGGFPGDGIRRRYPYSKT